MDNNTVLEKLETLQSLMDNDFRLRSYIDNGCAREIAHQLEAIREEIGEMPNAPSATNCRVSLPLPADYTAAAKAELTKRKPLLFGALGVTALMLVLFFTVGSDFLNTLAVLSIFATLGVFWFYRTSKATYETKAKEFNDAQKDFTGSLNHFRQALSCYEAETEAGRRQYVEYRLRHLEKYPDFMDVFLSYDDKLATANAELEENTARIMEIDVVTPEYYHLVSTIISMLKSGRADTYKEALNMAIEEERLADIEAARREEENRRIAAMERQAEEDRRHNMMMEEQQAAHNRAMERVAEDQAAEQRRANQQAERDRRNADAEARRRQDAAASEARKQAAATRSAGISKCASCRNSSRCPSHVKNNGSGLTCGGYVPY